MISEAKAEMATRSAKAHVARVECIVVASIELMSFLFKLHHVKGLRFHYAGRPNTGTPQCEFIA